MTIEAGHDEAFKAVGMVGFFASRGPLSYKQYFPNGYGASLACGERTKGGSEGLWELAVLHRKLNAVRFSFCYSTPITDDVIGYLTVKEALVLVARVRNLDIKGREGQ